MENFTEQNKGEIMADVEVVVGSSLKRAIEACLEKQVETGAEKIEVEGKPGLWIMTLALADKAEGEGARKIYPLESKDGKEMFLVQE
jgi:hypothetical protein